MRLVGSEELDVWHSVVLVRIASGFVIPCRNVLR